MKDCVYETNFSENLYCEMKKDNFGPIMWERV